MTIEVPQELFDQLKQCLSVAPDTSDAEVIRQALVKLQWQENERKAIQEGIDAMNQGQLQSFDEFDREFRAENNITPNA